MCLGDINVIPLSLGPERLGGELNHSALAANHRLGTGLGVGGGGGGVVREAGVRMGSTHVRWTRASGP